MREHDRKAGRTGKYIRPRFMVWENVPGAFSSNKGKDFQAVLQAIVSVTDDTATVPLPPKGKWQSAGCIMGDTYSIAWRTLDAQYWGVPQRRKRIYLVADFGGGTAPKILFEREGLSRDFAESREAWQRAAGDIKEGTHKAGTENVECYDISDRRRVADKSEVSPTLTTKMGTGGNNVPIVLENHPQDCRVTISEDGVVPTLTGKMGTGGGNVPMIINEARSVDLRNQRLGDDKAETLHGCGHGSSVAAIIEPQNNMGGTLPPITMQIRSGCEGGGKGALMQIDKSATLSTHNTQTLFEPIPIADKATRYKGGGDTRNNDGSANGLGVGEPGAPANTLTAADRHAVAYAIDRAAFNQGMMEYIIRRLTPLECCRLQGFPDDWTDNIAITEPKASVIREWMIAWAEWWRLIGKDSGIQLPKDAKQVERWLADPASDSGLYKMWGNGIALPCAMFVMEGIAEVLKGENSNESE